MEKITELCSVSWDYILYDVDGRKIITVMFFDLIDYYRSFYLSDSEIALDAKSLILLAEKIRTNAKNYEDRERFPPVFV